MRRICCQRISCDTCNHYNTINVVNAIKNLHYYLKRIIDSDAAHEAIEYAVGAADLFMIAGQGFTSYYNIVVLIDLSPEVCYTVGDAVDWLVLPTA